MKISISATVLTALYLASCPVNAFVTQRGSRFGKSPISDKVSSTNGMSNIAFERQNTALQVSFIQDRLKQIGESIDVDESYPFMQQLKRPLSFSEREIGLLVLLSVPVAWGTYASTVQSIYTIDPRVPGFLFSTCYFFVAASGSLLATFLTSRNEGEDGSASEPKTVPAIAGLELGFYVYLANFLHVIGLQSVPSDRAGFLFQLTTVMVPMLEAFFARDLMAIPPSTWAACALALAGIFVMGMEWPFGGAQEAATATAAMESMDQASSYVPDNMVSDLASSAAAAATMEPTSMALDSSALQTASLTAADSTQAIVDSSQAIADPSSLLSVLFSGDTLIVGAAFLYALQIIRISKWNSEYSPLQIMTGKTIAEFFFSFLFLGGTTWLATSGMDVGSNGLFSFLQNSGQQAIDFFHTVTQRFAEGSISTGAIEHFAGACLWTGLVTTCYLVFAQSYGQQYVKASDANLIYSLQPLFTAIFAYYMLGETLQPMGYVGGALIGTSVYLVATKSLSAEES